MIDLHCHSSASDGVVSPEDLPLQAVQAGVSALALTDHDTTEGLEAFLASAAHSGFQAIPGIELSCSMGPDKCHIVGLFLDAKCPELQQALQKIVQWRMERNEKILAKLEELGKPLTMEEVRLCGKDGCILGRPHIATAMVNRGYCASLEGAFKNYLRRGRPAYVVRQTLDAREALAILHKANAVTIWAHPMTNGNMTFAKLGRYLNEMRYYGLDGIEAYYPEHTKTQVDNVLAAAKARGLLISGGSDFHGGDRHVGISIGTGRGRGFKVPDELLPPIARCASHYKEKNSVKKFVFLDRDDTVIYNVPYLADPSRVTLTPGAGKALKMLSEAGYRLVLVTNQSGIGRGYFKEEDMRRVNARMMELLAQDGGKIDAVFFCPHTPQDLCNCRKPKTGLLECAVTGYLIDKSNSFFIGDSLSDIQTGKNFGIQTIQLKLPQSTQDDFQADACCSSLLEAADYILK